MNETAQTAAYKVCYSINGFKNSTQRYAYTYGTIRRADAAELRVGLDWALTQGLIQYGTTNASALRDMSCAQLAGLLDGAAMHCAV